MPPIAFAILFGLSMDYEVFLMSRIREEHIHGKKTIPAVRAGVAAIGRVVFAAAIIMSSVFFAFLLTPDRVSKEFGLLLAVAILVDALIMRLTVVPALLALLGERSWAMPGWLDRLLPKITIEPPTDGPPACARASRSGRSRSPEPFRRPRALRPRPPDLSAISQAAPTRALGGSATVPAWPSPNPPPPRRDGRLLRPPPCFRAGGGCEGCTTTSSRAGAGPRRT